MDKDKIKKIVRKHRHERAALLAILHEVQADDKQLDIEALKYISHLLKVPYANVYGLATFYSSFSTVKKGQTVIRACDGISCHLNGADEVIEALKSRLNLEMGATTWEETFSLEKVNCLGLCTIGPNVAFNTDTYPNLNKEKIEAILDILQKRTRKSK
jgi:NADH:ubiquinone oxidoreductase subunit E